MRFSEQVTARRAAPEDLDESGMLLLPNTAQTSAIPWMKILSEPFTVITPDSKNPYKQMYVAN